MSNDFAKIFSNINQQLEPKESKDTKNSSRTADALEKIITDAENDRQEQKRFNKEQKHFSVAIVVLTSIGIIIATIGLFVK